MTFDYVSIRDRAASMITRFGGEAILTAVTKVYDPATGTTANSSVSRTVAAVIKPRRVVGSNGLLVQQTVAVMTAPASVGDRLKLGDQEFAILEVESRAPAGLALVYTAILKR